MRSEKKPGSNDGSVRAKQLLSPLPLAVKFIVVPRERLKSFPAVIRAGSNDFRRVVKPEWTVGAIRRYDGAFRA